MNKRKRFFGLLAVLMLALLSVGLVSCGDDDDNVTVQGPNSDPTLSSPLQGEWKRVYDDESYEILTFNSNGRGFYEYHQKKVDHWVLDKYSEFTYFFDSNKMELKFIFPEEGGSTETKVCRVDKLTATELVLDGERYVHLFIIYS